MVRRAFLSASAPAADAGCAGRGRPDQARPPPGLSRGRVAFSYLGDIWTANEDGTGVQRITDNSAREVYPRFSPDGRWIAFSSNRYGNYDVFVVPATGGTPGGSHITPGPTMSSAGRAIRSR